MTVLSALRERFSTTESAAGPAGDAHGDPVGDPVAKAQLPFDGYDRLDARQVNDGLSDHSQIELEAVESYERSHQDREQVLAKLRWMRGSEPFAGYDALSTDDIVTTLGEADLATIKKVRAYERKFANRRDVMEAVVRVHHRGRANQPAKAAPAYAPTSYE